MRHEAPAVHGGQLAASETPICDRLLELGGRDVVSFHALPLSRSRSVRSSRLRGKFESLFGEALLRHDLTYTGECFDTPVVPRRCVEESRRQTARAFGARHSCYVTTGTTTSNYIAVFALACPNDRVLADRLCHQSIHLALAKNRCAVDYGSVRRRDEHSGRGVLDVEAFVAAYRAAAEAGTPYKLVVLNGCSYEGVIYDVEKIIGACLEIRDGIAFLVDEAWFAFGYFHPAYRCYTAMHAAGELARGWPGKRFAVVATQSAHKSLSCLRQGSYLHVHADDETVRRLQAAQYQLHTTSPSYPLLASLELARAQAVAEGAERIENCLRLADTLRRALRHDPDLEGYRVNESRELVDASTRIDALRISIDVRNVAESATAVREYLFAEHGVCVNHVTATALLVNVHIGIDVVSLERLLAGMRDFARQRSIIGDNAHVYA
jgi:arginine/lysine/ornithine decarboxylase